MVRRTFLKKKTLSFNVFFCFLTNSLFVSQSFVWSRYDLPFTTFCVSKISVASGARAVVLKFFDQATSFWKLFWEFAVFGNRLSSGFFVEMELVGLGFRIKKIIPQVYRFFWGYANYIYLFAPRTLLVEYAAEERIIFFFSLDPAVVFNFSTYLLLLKKLSTYRVTGFIKPGKIIRLNSGKQR